MSEGMPKIEGAIFDTPGGLGYLPVRPRRRIWR